MNKILCLILLSNILASNTFWITEESTNIEKIKNKIDYCIEIIKDEDVDEFKKTYTKPERFDIKQETQLSHSKEKSQAVVKEISVSNDSANVESVATQGNQNVQAGPPAPISPNYNFVIVDPDVKESVIKEFNKQISCLPQYIINDFENSGWSVYLTTEALWKITGLPQGSYMGDTYYERRCIYIDNRDKAVRESLLHEIGHWFSYNRGLMTMVEDNIYTTQEWHDIYLLESPNVGLLGIGNYGQTDSNEYFAECFMVYFHNPGLLQLSLPQTYEVINNMVNY